MEKVFMEGACLARCKETSAHCSQCFRKSKLYKMRLFNTHPTLFGDYSNSNQWDLPVKAMKDDFLKRETLVFMHPNDSGKAYVRHYIGSPVNGNAFLMVGQFKKDMDFAFIRIVMKSKIYVEPYIVLEKYSQSFRNPDILAKMVESAFNWVLKGQGVKLVLEPWEPDEQVMWLLDYEESFMNEMAHIAPNDLIMVGYEDALEDYMMKLARKNEDRKPKISKKSDDILVYIMTDHKEAILKFLHQAVKGQMTPKEITRPFRFLYDHKITDRIPFKAVIKEFPELAGLLDERRYNNWTNPNSTSYDYDPHYINLKASFDLVPFG